LGERLVDDTTPFPTRKPMTVISALRGFSIACRMPENCRLTVDRW
jgi:hypothetical protein